LVGRAEEYGRKSWIGHVDIQRVKPMVTTFNFTASLDRGPWEYEQVRAAVGKFAGH
jgi:hypothetical protein